MSWWVLCLLTFSSALLTITPPPDVEGGTPVDFLHYDADYCTPPPQLTDIPLVLIEPTPKSAGCVSFTFPDVSGKIAYLPECLSCCKLAVVAQALQQAGALGVIQPGDVLSGLINSGLTTALSIFCYGILSGNFTDEVETALSNGETATATAFQPPVDPDTKAALLSIYTQSGKAPWDITRDPCQGALTTVPTRPYWQGVVCTVDGVITSLTLKFPINGRLPDNLCAMNSLTSLTIQDDASFLGLPATPCSFPVLQTLILTGGGLKDIPNTTWTLPQLNHLDLTNNGLSGPLPTVFSNQLSYLGLGGNEFSGTIPSSMFQINPLQTLYLSQNNLVGVLPDFTVLSGLQYLDVSDNYLTNLTDPAGAATSLITLKLSLNNFSYFPQNLLTKIPAISILSLDHNSFTQLPDLSVATFLRTLDISSNQLSGSFVVPPLIITLLAANNFFTSIGPGNQQLQKLDFTNNQLTTFPPPFRILTGLFLGSNLLTSADFTGFVSVITADLSNNMIGGDLNIVLVTSLYSLDLSNNKLTGIIPAVFLNTLVVLRLLGNSLSHGSSALLPPQVEFTFATSRPFAEQGLECPTYSIKDVRQSELDIDPSYHDYTLCRCAPGYYRLPGVSEYCSPCLPNAICPGKENPLTLDANANILADAGYYPIPDTGNPTQMLPCRFGVVLATDPNNPCNPQVQSFVSDAYNESRPVGQAVTRFSCATGYSDRLCSRCVSGYFRKEGRCLKCNNRAEYPLFLIVIVIVFLCACVYFTIRTPVDTSTTSINPDGWTFEPKQRIYDFIPLVLHFFQTSTIVLVKLDALDVVQTLNSVLVSASFSTPQSGIGFECGLPVFQGFVTQYLAVVIFPPVLALVLVFFFIGRLIQQRYNGVTIVWSMTWYQYVYGIGSMMEAIHFPLVTYVLGVFQCTKDPLSGVSYFTDHPYLTCDSISPAGKIFPLLLYPIGLVGFFIGLGVYLHYAPSDVKESEPILQAFAFFFIRFKPDRVASGVFFILVNLSLSLVVGLMEANTDVFPTLVVLILIVDFFFVTVFQPYLQPRYNKVRSVNDLVALLLFVNNLIYSSTGQFPGRSASPATIYLGLNSGMIIFYVYHLYRIMKLHRSDHTLARMGRANSGAIDPHQGAAIGGRHKHLELTDIKTRKHTNIDPPSTSGGDNHGVYVPVSTQSPATAADGVENSTHSPLPIISETETHEFPNSTKNGTNQTTTNTISSSSTTTASSGLVFTSNPLADTSDHSGHGETSAEGQSHPETPPSPSHTEE